MRYKKGDKGSIIQTDNQSYIIELSYGCPSERFPLNGIFQFDQAKALQNAGENVIYVAIDMRSVRKWRRWGITFHIVEGMKVYEYNIPFGPIFTTIRDKLRKICFVRLMKRITKIYGFPKVLHIHNCDVAYCASDYCIKNKIPYVITEHSTPEDNNKKRKAIRKCIYTNAKHVIAVSKALKQQLSEVYGIYPNVIPNIVDLSNFSYINSKKSDRPFCFVSAARIVQSKGIDILLKAFTIVLKSNPEARLVILGDGAFLDNMKRLAKDLGILKSVTFKGEYKRCDFSDQLSKSDCFVLPSRTESFGIVYIEALACGTPVIATKCGGPEDFINKNNGILVPIDDIDALTEAMIYMIKFAKLYNRYDISQKCKEDFSSERVAKEILGLLKA